MARLHAVDEWVGDKGADFFVGLTGSSVGATAAEVLHTATCYTPNAIGLFPDGSGATACLLESGAFGREGKEGGGASRGKGRPRHFRSFSPHFASPAPCPWRPRNES